mmetsp:Transcript_23729/g.67622  ORF Transcript_23729/g.67622 Transcript_23729/m.67622 type:complete len:442 (-) Transcript_23729:28-1353(-)
MRDQQTGSHRWQAPHEDQAQRDEAKAHDHLRSGLFQVPLYCVDHLVLPQRHEHGREQHGQQQPPAPLRRRAGQQRQEGQQLQRQGASDDVVLGPAGGAQLQQHLPVDPLAHVDPRAPGGGCESLHGGPGRHRAAPGRGEHSKAAGPGPHDARRRPDEVDHAAALEEPGQGGVTTRRKKHKEQHYGNWSRRRHRTERSPDRPYHTRLHRTDPRVAAPPIRIHMQPQLHRGPEAKQCATGYDEADHLVHVRIARQLFSHLDQAGHGAVGFLICPQHVACRAPGLLVLGVQQLDRRQDLGEHEHDEHPSWRHAIGSLLGIDIVRSGPSPCGGAVCWRPPLLASSRCGCRRRLGLGTGFALLLVLGRCVWSSRRRLRLLGLPPGGLGTNEAAKLDVHEDGEQRQHAAQVRVAAKQGRYGRGIHHPVERALACWQRPGLVGRIAVD